MCKDCNHKGDLVWRGGTDIYCRFYHDYRDMKKTESCNHDTSKGLPEKNFFYIIEPQCHGNGGWCGSTVVGEYTSIKAALKTKPRWRPEYSPYDGHIMNKPRLSPSPDPNEATHFFDWDTGKWKEIRNYD